MYKNNHEIEFLHIPGKGNITSIKFKAELF